MTIDPGAVVLRQMSLIESNQETESVREFNDINIVDTRTVPGGYSIWTERKFYVFG